MKKLLLRLLTAILFVITVILIIHPFRWSLPLTTGLSLLLNLIIILSATYFGARGLVTLGAFSLLAILIHSLRISEFAISPILLLGTTICIFYSYCFKLNRFTRNTRVQLDNIEEEKNVLTVELQHSRQQNTSFKQKLHRHAALKELTETLSSTLSLDETLALISGETLRIVGKSSACLLYLVDKKKQELNLVSTKLADAEYEVELKKGDIFDNWIFKQRIPLVVRDTKKDFRFNIQDAKRDPRSVRSLIAVPLIRENKLLGILRLDDVSPDSYDADDLRLLDIIANLSAVAVENTLLYQEMNRLAITDGLTGLFVHRYFQQRFEQEVSRAHWTDSCFAFLMIDIDNFKNYNDRYGHIAGDIVLKKIAKLITCCVNPGDIVARYGGEEFGILLVNTAKKEAQEIAQAVREKIEKEDFILRRQTTKVSVSGGISFYPQDGKVKENLIQRADQALYKAKAKGKNRICTS